MYKSIKNQIIEIIKRLEDQIRLASENGGRKKFAYAGAGLQGRNT
jgi:hypothetical protein